MIHFYSRCGLPVCNEACEEGYLHRNYECPVFAKAFDKNPPSDSSSTCCNDEDPPEKQKRKLPQIENMNAPCPFYTCITPLRLLLRLRDGPKNGETVGT